MKIKKTMSKRIIVSTLSTVMGVSLVGAITGTVAWYQYSTRSTISYVGSTISSSKNLLIAINSTDDNAFHNDQTYVDNPLAPVTTGAQSKNADLQRDQTGKAILYGQPIYQHFGYNEWLRADDDTFVQFTVYLKLVSLDENGNEEFVNEQRKIFLTDLVIQNDANNAKSDISDAIRVHLSSDHANMLLSNSNINTDVYGPLDLNADGEYDIEEVKYDWVSGTQGTYGTANAAQESYVLNDVKPQDYVDGKFTNNTSYYLGILNSPVAVVPAQDTDVSGGEYFTDPDLADEHIATGTANGTDTYYTRERVLPVTVTIWLEGWQKFDTVKSTYLAAGYEFENSPINYYTDADLQTPAEGTAVANTKYYFSAKEATWDPAKYVGSIFDVGLMFEVEERE